MIEKNFNEYFSNWDITLPCESTIECKSGVIQSRGWNIRYLFGSNNKGNYLDFYASHRMTDDRHIRLYASGKIENLPSMWDMITYPTNANEQEKLEAERKFHENNNRVMKILKEKGFYWINTLTPCFKFSLISRKTDLGNGK